MLKIIRWFLLATGIRKVDPAKFKLKVTPSWFSNNYMTVHYYDGVSWMPIEQKKAFCGDNFDYFGIEELCTSTSIDGDYSHLKIRFPDLKSVLKHNANVMADVIKSNNLVSQRHTLINKNAKTKIIC